ncbi:MAG: hypothetical protein IPM36_09605 [Lewinellaceae bacterium]|nr:hypothetical protein [Lewinellaceae bacterium]
MDKFLSLLIKGFEIIETFFINILTFLHQNIFFFVTLGKSYDEEHRILRARQFIYFFLIVSGMYALILFSQVTALIAGSEVNMIFVGVVIVQFIFLVVMNYGFAIIYLEQIILADPYKGTGIWKFFIIPVILFFVGLIIPKYWGSLIGAIYPLILIVSHLSKIPKGKRHIKFWIKSFNYIFHDKNIKIFSIYFILIMVIDLYFRILDVYEKLIALNNDFEKENGEKIKPLTEVENKLNFVSDLSNYLLLIVAAVHLIKQLKKRLDKKEEMKAAHNKA